MKEQQIQALQQYETRIEGIKRTSIWFKGNDDSFYLIRDLAEELAKKKLKILGYVNGTNSKYSPTITLITVKEDLERPSKNTLVKEEDIITYHQFTNGISIGAGSKQYKILREVLEIIRDYSK